MNIYDPCPVFEDETYFLRLVEKNDAEDLLKVYSDEKSVPLFNGDNCHGDDFHYTTIERMNRQIDFWLFEYAGGAYTRWTIVDKRAREAIGSVECFKRMSDVDRFTDCGLLRLDLRSDYETYDEIRHILRLILPPLFKLYDCRIIATKIPPIALERRRAATDENFKFSEEKLVNAQSGKMFSDYYVLKRTDLIL